MDRYEEHGSLGGVDLTLQHFHPHHGCAPFCSHELSMQTRPLDIWPERLSVCVVVWAPTAASCFVFAAVSGHRELTRITETMFVKFGSCHGALLNGSFRRC